MTVKCISVVGEQEVAGGNCTRRGSIETYSGSGTMAAVGREGSTTSHAEGMMTMCIV